MDAFPAFFPLAGRTVVIAGAGPAAEAKARLFVGSPARLVRLEGPDALDAAAYAGATLAFVAGGDRDFQRGAREAAHAAGVPVNVVDRFELCDFTTPAVIDRGQVVAAVGAGGAAPALSALLRGDIEARMPAGVGRLAAVLRTLQGEVRAALPDIAARRAFLREALDGPGAAAALAGDVEKAKQLLRQALSEARAGRSLGLVSLIEADGPSDLITLRAARRLAEADVLVFAPDAPAELAGMARRDARRLDPAQADLAALAGEGQRVVVCPPPARDALRRLAAQGVRVERLERAADVTPDR